MTALTVHPRVRELAREAADPARSALSRELCAEEVAHRLRRDNPGAQADEIDAEAARLLAEAPSVTARPLDADEVAARVSTAVMRAWQALNEARQLGLGPDVLASHRLAVGALEGLREEVAAWSDAEPQADAERAPQPPGMGPVESAAADRAVAAWEVTAAERTVAAAALERLANRKPGAVPPPDGWHRVLNAYAEVQRGTELLGQVGGAWRPVMYNPAGKINRRSVDVKWLDDPDRPWTAEGRRLPVDKLAVRIPQENQQ